MTTSVAFQGLQRDLRDMAVPRLANVPVRRRFPARRTTAVTPDFGIFDTHL